MLKVPMENLRIPTFGKGKLSDPKIRQTWANPCSLLGDFYKKPAQFLPGNIFWMLIPIYFWYGLVQEPHGVKIVIDSNP